MSLYIKSKRGTVQGSSIFGSVYEIPKCDASNENSSNERSNFLNKLTLTFESMHGITKCDRVQIKATEHVPFCGAVCYTIQGGVHLFCLWMKS